MARSDYLHPNPTNTAARTTNGNLDPLHSTATLEPDIYRLVVALRSPDAAPELDQHFAYGVIFFDFTVVPEPDTGLLVMAGLIGLTGGRRARA